MSIKMTNAILTIHFGLKRNSKYCHNYVLPQEVIRKIGSNETYTKKATDSESTENDIIDFCFDDK